MRQRRQQGTLLRSKHLVFFSRSKYHTFSGEEDPRFDMAETDPETRKSLTKYYSMDFAEILVGWKIRLSDGRVGTILNCRKRFMRAAVYDVSLTDKAFTEQIVLNRKSRKNRRKYMDFELISKEF